MCNVTTINFGLNGSQYEQHDYYVMRQTNGTNVLTWRKATLTPIKWAEIDHLVDILYKMMII